MQVMAKLQQGNAHCESDAKFNINMGVMLQRQGDQEKAIEFLSKASAASATQKGSGQEEFAANYNLAIALLQSNQLSQALTHFNKALQLIESENRSPNVEKADTLMHKVSIYVNLSVIHEKQSNVPEALNNINLALKLAPDNVKIQ